MRLEEYLGSLPQEIVTGQDVQLRDESLRDMFRLAGLGPDDTLCHLGCGDGRGLEIALREFGAAGAVGIDSDPEKIAAAGRRQVPNARLECADAREAELGGATVVLSWFADPDIAVPVSERLARLGPGCRIVTILDPMPGAVPDEVRFPYLLHRAPVRQGGPAEQIRAIFGADCIDFVTAWEHAERYTAALAGPGAQNSRFLTILQTVVMWINARNHGVSCTEEMPESVKTYVSILREFFDIDVAHLVRD